MSEEEDRDTGFICPSCSGHYFGTSNVLSAKAPRGPAPSGDSTGWVVHCHTFPCSWKGPYDEHVTNDPDEVERLNDLLKEDNDDRRPPSR